MRQGIQPMGKNFIVWKESGKLEDLWRKEKTVEEENVLLGGAVPKENSKKVNGWLDETHEGGKEATRH